MRYSLIFRRVFAAAVLAAGIASSAWAGPASYYETSISSPAAPGASGTTGGLCANGNGLNCPSFSILGLTAGPLLGTSPNLYIALTSPFTSTAAYSVTISLSGYSTSSFGADWTVSLINPIAHTGVSLFTTPSVGSNVDGGGSKTLILTGNGTFDIGITELVSLSSPYQIFSLTYSISQVPEPATFGLFAGGLVALGMVFRRRASFH